jgi:hypothetical protein
MEILQIHNNTYTFTPESQEDKKALMVFADQMTQANKGVAKEDEQIVLLRQILAEVREQLRILKCASWNKT